MDRTALADALRDAGMPQREAARLTGVAHGSMHRYLTGQRQPQPDRTAHIRAVLTAKGIAVPENPWAVVGSSPTKRAAKPKEKFVIPSRTDLDEPDLKYFGLADDPFDIPIPASSTWTCDRTTFVDRAVLKAVRRRRIVAVVGDVGAGKTTLLRRLHWQLQQDASLKVRFLTPGNLNRASIDEGALSAAMLRDLGGGNMYSSSAEHRGEALRKLLDERRREGELTTLWIDEAHRMVLRGLIAVKEIWDSYTYEKSLSVVLVGQLSLREKLESDPRVKELTGRTRIVDLPQFGVAEIASYLDFRLRLAGRGLADVFQQDAINALARRGAVYPLWIDAIGSQAIQQARKTRSKRVTAALVAAC